MTDVRDLAHEILAAQDVNTRLARWNFVVKPTLRPGLDLHDGILYMTIPLSRTEPVTRGKGKNAITRDEEVMRTMVVTSQADFFDYEPFDVTSHGFVFPDTWLQATESRWPRPNVETYLRGQAPIIDQRGLFETLRQLWLTYVEYSEDIYYKLVPLFVLTTYVYPLFQHAPYLHFHGTANSGKSQNLRLLKALAFNTRTSSNMSTSSIFRSTAGDPGLLCIDEAESFDSERGQEIRQLLNSGYQKGMPAYRMEKDGETWQTKQYDVFCPKALASINPLDTVLGSRCLTVPMATAIRAIPELRDEDPNWPAYRNQLYLWALQNAAAIDGHNQLWQNTLRYRPDAKGLTNRMWDVSAPFIVIADYLGIPGLAEDVIAFFNTYFAETQKNNEATDRILILLKALPEVFRTKYPILEGWWSLKDIHEITASYLDEDATEYYKTKQTGRHLSSLGWKDRQTHKGGTLVAITEDEVRSNMRRRHVQPDPAHLAWFNGEESFVRPPLQPGATQTALTGWNIEDPDGDDH